MISERDASAYPPPTAGLHVIGYFLNWGLFGALCVQVFLFYWAFPKDKLHLKLIVYGLFASDIVQTALITRDAFFKFGTHFGDATIFGSLQNLWFSVFIINAINSAVVQLFFAYRITLLSKSKVLGALVAILALAGCGAGIASGAQAKLSKINNLGLIALNTEATFTTFLSTAAVCDIFITTSMVTILSKNRGTGTHPATHNTITKIIWLTVETAVVAILTMALNIAFPAETYCNILIDIIGKIYSNNFLVILNRRIKIVDSRSIVLQSSVQPGSLHFSPPESKEKYTTNETLSEIRIQREVWTESNGSREGDM
ncbi:hypothetical protein L218DRAFT_950858 [Marasmius fiardii PR-910]|nr:hypothetical protein L218DRAFT_950858 [Marasmius fiardii PR-910]